MPGLFDGETIDLECPNCDRKIKMKISQLKRPGNKCPGCEASFDTAEFKRELDKVDREIKKFERDIRNLDIKL